MKQSADKAPTMSFMRAKPYRIPSGVGDVRNDTGRLRPRALRGAIVGGLVMLLALVGPSRIHQGHHWPTDVAASYLLGTSYLIVLIGLYRRVKGDVGRSEDAQRGTPA